MKYIKARLKEYSSFDGTLFVAIGMLILFLTPLAKIAAGISIVYGIYKIFKSEQ